LLLYRAFSLVLNLSQVYLGHFFTFYFFKVHFNIIIRSTPISSVLPFSFGFSYQNSACSYLSAMHNEFLAHLTLLDFLILIKFPERQKLKSPALSNFLQCLVTLFPLSPNVVLCTTLPTLSPRNRDFLIK
jgi:hypothetical protein